MQVYPLVPTAKRINCAFTFRFHSQQLIITTFVDLLSRPSYLHSLYC